MVVRNSEMLGVARKGTGRLASKSPWRRYVKAEVSHVQLACVLRSEAEHFSGGERQAQTERGGGGGGAASRYLRDLQHLGIESVEVQDELHGFDGASWMVNILRGRSSSRWRWGRCAGAHSLSMLRGPCCSEPP